MAFPAMAALGAGGGMSSSNQQETSFFSDVEVSPELTFGSYNGGVATMGAEPPLAAMLTGGNPWVMAAALALAAVFIMTRKGGK